MARSGPNPPASSARANSVVLGLTRSGYTMRYKIGYETRHDSATAGVCLRIKSLTYTFYMGPLVFIASDLPKNSCIHDVVLAHEARHAGIFLDIAKAYVASTRRELTDFVYRQDYRYEISDASVERRMKAVQDALDGYTNLVLAHMDQDNLPRQAEVDSPESHAREEAACPGEFSHLPRY